MLLDVDVISAVTSENAGLLVDTGVVGIGFVLAVAAAGGEAVADGDLRTGIHLFAVVLAGVLT